MPLGMRAQIAIHRTLRTIDSHNVIAKRTGSDSKLKDQFVIYSAHWDHFGIGPEVKGDRIYHGGQGQRSSDHFSFAKQGVPAFDPDEGVDYIGKPEGWGMQMRQKYTQEDYHKPSDVIKPYWDLSGAVQDCQLFFLVGYRVANDPKMPEWKPGAEFKAKREASLRAAGMTP